MRMKMWGALGSPIAAGRPFTVMSANGARQDDYHRLRDDARITPEITGRIRQNDSSVSDRKGTTAPLLAWAGENGICR